MPELPEVEVVKRSLKRKILNLIIKKVKINDVNLRYKINIDAILKLKGKSIRRVYRRSKFLIFEINKNFFVLVHLGMTGKFFFIDKEKKKYKTSFYYHLDNKDKKHDRVIFFFQNNQKLIYNDVRKFGFIKLYNSIKPNKILHLKNLGPEPLSKNLNFYYLKNYFFGRKRNIKDILMDQKCISGLGNIYVNEILFYSGVKPMRKVKSLKDFEIKKIIKSTKKILNQAIKSGGSSIKDFSSDNGKQGVFQQKFKVYGLKGESCSNIDCNKIITKLNISNRSSFFCKSCQK
mgnify:CR=1 FL=1